MLASTRNRSPIEDVISPLGRKVIKNSFRVVNILRPAACTLAEGTLERRSIVGPLDRLLVTSGCTARSANTQELRLVGRDVDNLVEKRLPPWASRTAPPVVICPVNAPSHERRLRLNQSVRNRTTVHAQTVLASGT